MTMNNGGVYDERIKLDDFLQGLTKAFKDENRNTTDILEEVEEKRSTRDYIRMEDNLKALEDIKEESAEMTQSFIDIKDAILGESQETQATLRAFVMEFEDVINGADFTDNTQTAAINQWAEKNTSILNSLNVNNEVTSGFLEQSLLRLAGIERSSSSLLRVQKIDLDRALNRDKEDKRRENVSRSTKNEGIFGEFFNKIKSFGLILSVALGGLLYASKYFDGAGNWFEPIKEFVDVIVNGLGKLVVNLIDGVEALGPELEEFAKIIGPFLSKVFTGLIDGLIGIGPVIKWITSSLLTITAEYMKLYTDFPLAMSVATGTLISGMKAFTEFISGPLTKFSTWLGELGGVGGKLVSLGENIIGWGKTIFGWFDNVTGIFSKVGKWGGVFLKFFKFLGWPMTIIMSIVDFVKGWQNTEGDYVDKFIGGVKQIVVGLMEPFTLIWDWFKSTDIGSAIVNKLSEWVTSLWDWLSEFNLFKAYIGFFKDLWNNVVTNFQEIFKGNIFSGFTNLIMLLPKKILEHVLKYLRDSFGNEWGVGKAIDWLMKTLGFESAGKNPEVNQVPENTTVTAATAKAAPEIKMPPLVVNNDSTNKALNDLERQKNTALTEAAKKTEDTKAEQKIQLTEQTSALKKAAEASVTAATQQKNTNNAMTEQMNNMIAHTNVGGGQGGRGTNIPVGPDMLATLSGNYWAP